LGESEEIMQYSNKDIADLVVTAFEGGIQYWCPAAGPVIHAANGNQNGAPDPNIKIWRPMTDAELDPYIIDGVVTYSNPDFWIEGNGYLLKIDDDGEEVAEVLTAAMIREALDKPPKEPSRYWDDMLDRLRDPGAYDADDADTIIQYAVFGEQVYG